MSGTTYYEEQVVAQAIDEWAKEKGLETLRFLAEELAVVVCDSIHVLDLVCRIGELEDEVSRLDAGEA